MLYPPHYWLENAQVPVCLVAGQDLAPQTPDGLAAVDLEIVAGKIQQIRPHQHKTEELDNIPRFDLQKKLIFPCFVDIHTHLDKGHTWPRSPNPDGTFEGALEAVFADVQQYYRAEDVYRRMDFGLKCSYAHGTIALRTHIDSFGQQGQIGFEVFQALRQAWQGKLDLQAACLVSVDYYLTPDGVSLADQMAEQGLILGGVAYQNPDLKQQLAQVFRLAQERGLDLDLHVDETDDPNSQVLHQVALTALETGFTGKILCGHCCSLANQAPAQVQQTLALVKQARIGIVSLPLCNLYLQGRTPGQTPYWRGLTTVHEIKQAGIPLSFASDNCRDPFYAFGDHDGLEVLTQAIRLGHLDHPYDDWCTSVTQIPAEFMALPHLGRLSVGGGADFILFKARYFSELFARPQQDRCLIRQGQRMETVLPDYAELDDLVHFHT